VLKKVSFFAVLLVLGCATKEKNEPGGGTSGSGATGGGNPAGGTGANAGQGGTAGTVASGGSGGTSSTSGGGGGHTSGGGAGGTGGAGAAGGAGGTGGRAAGSGGASAKGGSSGTASSSSGAGGSGGDVGGTGGGGGSTTPGVHFVGRVDDADPANAKFAWSGTGVTAHFDGTEVSANLGGSQQYTVVVDGEVKPKLTATNGANLLATGLAAGEHTVELYRRTEASQGVATFMGFDFGGGKLLAPVVPSRRLEFIGDSITCGYGVEGPDMNCGFSADTENHYLTYAALTARALEAELSTVAWSGKGAVCNYGDTADACQNPLPTYYDRILPDDAASSWTFSRFVADAVVVNLGTNDFGTTTDPTQMEFESGYRALLERVRAKYPQAYILCTNGPMLSGADLTTLMGYIKNVITAMGDSKISSFDIATQDGSDGYGCDWHPSKARHEKMATVVTAELKSKLGW